MFFTVEKIEKQLKEIRAAIHRAQIDIPQYKYLEWDSAVQGMHAVPGAENPDFDDQNWKIFHLGDFWGGYDRAAWFRTWLEVPPEWRDKKLALRFLVGPKDRGNSTAEALLFVNGSPLQALDVWHPEAWLPSELLQDGRVFIAVKAWSGVMDVPERRQFRAAQLAWVDEETRLFHALGQAVLRSIKLMDENDLRRIRLLQILNQAFHRIDFRKPKSEDYYRSIHAAADFLRRQVEELQQVVEIKPSVVGIGHAHIDMAWLWRLQHTREKAARTFTTALHLMDQYPDYRFLHSSPQLYQYLKTDYPQIYRRVKDRIRSGEWEINGGMWVEADTNLPNGESLIRQFLFGKRFVREEFGQDMKILWLPDVFGYSWALPQIAKKCGIDHFVTSKISWSQFNRFPYDTFLWRGIDGTELVTHFITTPENGSWHYTYNGEMGPDQVKGIWDNYQQKEINDELLMLYGWGDGGGGPTREMIESARALKNLPGIPGVSLGRADTYLERLAQRLEGKDVPLWDGELYLEYHRGTYTSQAFIKRANRKAEVLYHNAEWMSALSDLLCGEDRYPASALRSGWELLLLNQFHDILPGSSIRQVYEDCRVDYGKIFAIGQQAAARAQESLFSQFPAGQAGLLVMNPNTWNRTGFVEIPWRKEFAGLSALRLNGSSSSLQVNDVAEEKTVLVEVKDVPAFGYSLLPLGVSETAPAAVGVENALIGHQPGGHAPTRDVGSSIHLDQGGAAYPGLEEDPLALPSEYPGGEPAVGKMTVTPTLLENAYYRIRLNENGQIVSLWDKRCRREVIAPGAAGNVFQAFEDKPMNFDAWDVDIYYQEKMSLIQELVDAVVEEAGPLRGVLCLRWRYFDSTITQRLTVYRHSPRIDFRTHIDWNEQQTLLKAAFPVDVRATRATYDIQFGSIVRPTHWNTSWDYARFENLGHKWADLSEGDYGVSLLNDCKYGYDIKDNVLRLTLLKSAVSPDETADQGEHVFTYSLLPHAGGWRDGGVVEEACALNSPLVGQVSQGSSGGDAFQDLLPSQYQLARVDADNVILETIKKAESGDAWIIRLYEYKQCRKNEVAIRFGPAVRKAVECNLIEEEEKPAEFDGRRLKFSITPFEIKTFKVWFET